jgi:DNA-binding NtrC family response regulator
VKDSTSNPLRVIVVDDERSIADSLVEILRLRGHEAHSVYSGERALELLPTFVPEVLIADVVMAGMNGIELARRMAERLPGCRIVLFSGQAEVSQALLGPEVVSAGFRLYPKPIHPDVLLELIEGEEAGPRAHVPADLR